MPKRLLVIPIMVLMAVSLIQCTDDEETNPVDPALPDTTLQFSGVTTTDDLGYILDNDTADWCYGAGKSAEGELPTEYALYPAFPNPSYYSFNFIYDLPVQSAVHLFIIDTSAAIISELVQETQPAGRYLTGWDIRDTTGSRVDPGIYRVMLTAGDFECYGDIEVVAPPEPDSRTLVVYTELTDDGLDLTYDSPDKIGALWLVFVFNGVIGSPIYDSATFRMNVMSAITVSSLEDEPDTLKILISTPVNPMRAMPSGQNELCFIPVESGQIALDYVEASDSLGTIMPTAIVKIP